MEREGMTLTFFYEMLHKEMESQLSELEEKESVPLEQLKHSVEICRKALSRLKEFISGYQFTSIEEEILFFKQQKPLIESTLLYYTHLLQLSAGVPGGGKTQRQQYYQNDLNKISKFFTENEFLWGYYKSGATYLDDKLFVRAGDIGWLYAATMVLNDMDGALCDRFVAIALGYEKVAAYLETEMNKLHNCDIDITSRSVTSKIKWTDSNVALIELMYALYRKGSLNNGVVKLKDIAELLESVFGINLGNYYRTFQEIRIRKGERTNFLNQLKRVLTQYMDETDLNYRG